MSTNLKVLFWNVWCLPQCFTDGKYSSEKRAKLIAPLLAGYDVVLLCEAWTESAKKVFKKTYPYYYTDKTPVGKLAGTGLMVLSNYPIINPSHEYFKHGSDSDWFAGKGIMHFQIQVNQKTIDFFLTHMQATYSNYSVASQTARLYQSLHVTKFVNKKLAGNNSKEVWFIGDFNLWPYHDRDPNNVNDYDDSTMRSACYEMIKHQIKMSDIQPDIRSVYRVFTRRTDNQSKVAYQSGQGLTDGPSVVLDIPLL